MPGSVLGPFSLPWRAGPPVCSPPLPQKGRSTLSSGPGTVRAAAFLLSMQTEWNVPPRV